MPRSVIYLWVFCSSAPCKPLSHYLQLSSWPSLLHQDIIHQDDFLRIDVSILQSQGQLLSGSKYKMREFKAKICGKLFHQNTITHQDIIHQDIIKDVGRLR